MLCNNGNQIVVSYGPEIYETEMRAFGYGAILIIGKVSAAMGPSVIMMFYEMGIVYFLQFMAVISLVAFLCSVMLEKETSGRDLDG